MTYIWLQPSSQPLLHLDRMQTLILYSPYSLWPPSPVSILLYNIRGRPSLVSIVECGFPFVKQETESGHGIMEEPELTLTSTSDISIAEMDFANLTLEEKRENEAKSCFQVNLQLSLINLNYIATHC